MTAYFCPPSVDMLVDFVSLETTLKKDGTGERARSLARYFADAELESRTAQLRSTDFPEKHMAGLLAEAFAAARRVVPEAWNKLHGRELSASPEPHFPNRSSA